MPHPEYSPQLATLVSQPPAGDEWLHEIKFDGYRIGCRVNRGRATLISRNGKDWTAAFPDVAAAASATGANRSVQSLPFRLCKVARPARTTQPIR